MTLTITIADTSDALRVIEGIANATNWTAASGKTKTEWAKLQVINQIIAMARTGEIRMASSEFDTELKAIVFT